MRYFKLSLWALLAMALLASGHLTLSADADPAVTGYPDSMAAIGDSITRATNSDAIGDQPQNSWSTGTSASVQSLYSRILAQNPGISGNNYNLAVAGARMEHLDGQAANVVAQGVEFVTILMGANDVCTSSEATMTPVATLRAQFEQAMDTLTLGLPDARIFVASIPDIYILWDILHDTSAVNVWNLFSICQSLLENPTSMDQGDVERRDRVRQRNIEFNQALEEVCAEYVHCRFDGYAAFNYQFVAADVSTIDHFHPSVVGQTAGASGGWTATFDFTDDVPPSSQATVVTSMGGPATMTITASDDVGLSGIEYRLNGGPYQRYDDPLTLATGDSVIYRAVDVNGNAEGTHTCAIGAWTVPAGDGDCDGSTDAQEAFMDTDPADACPDDPDHDAWPLDLASSQGYGKHDGTVNVLDIVHLTPPTFNSSPPSPNYTVRKDFNADGAINILDIVRLTPPVFGQSCS